MLYNSSNKKWKKGRAPFSIEKGARPYLFIILCMFVSHVYAEEKPAQVAQDMQVEQRLGEKVEFERSFTDQRGALKPLKDILDKEKPTILVPAYYNCPRLCSLVLNGVRDVVPALGLNLRSDYRIATLSFDPTENFDLAAAKYANYMKSLGLSAELEIDHGWDFLVGSADNVSATMTEVGYPYRRDGKDFSHGAAIVILSPDGTISRYLFGIEFNAKDLRLALVEASNGGIGSVVDQVMLFCFRFDPTKGRYTWEVFAAMKIFGALTLLILIPFIVILWRKHS